MKRRLGAKDAARLRQLETELSVVRLDASSVFDALMPDLRQLLQTDTLLLICPERRADGWGIERYHGDNLPDASRFQRTFTRFLASAPHRFAWYDAVRPEPAQRNRVLDPFAIIPAGEFERSGIYHELLVPTQLERHRQLRVLICDGPSLLGWFGTFHTGPIDDRLVQLFTALTPSMQRRLAIERRLQLSPRTSLALDAALEQLGRPAMVIGRQGQVFEANAAAQVLLRERGADVHGGLVDALTGRASSLQFTLVPLSGNGLPRCWLATFRQNSAQEEISNRVALAAARWRLTPRQRTVLRQLIEGHSNASIAAIAGTSERAVELHVTALLDHAGVNSRAAVVAQVLLGL